MNTHGLTKRQKIMAGIAAAGTIALVVPALVFAKTNTSLFHSFAQKFTPPAAVGTVASVSGETITLTGKNGTTYTVNASGATVTKFTPGTNGAKGSTSTISVSQIQNGDSLVVIGTVSGDNVTATKIMDGKIGGPRGGVGAHHGTSGTVTANNNGVITLQGKNGTTYTVNASGATVTKFANGTSTAITVADIQTGDNLMVQGTLSGTTVTATKIIDGTFPRGGNWGNQSHPGVFGTVASVSGDTIILNGKNGTTYTVNASGATVTEISNGSKTTIGVSGIQNEDTLMVQGTVSGTNVTATQIIDGIMTHPFMHPRPTPTP